MTLLAHAGHWLPQLLYLVPVAVMAAAVGWGKLKERRNKRKQSGGAAAPPGPPAL
jgi:hypothetical protein